MITHLAPWCGSLLPKVKYGLTTHHKMGWIRECRLNGYLLLYNSHYPTLKSYFLRFLAYLPTQTEGSKNVFQDRQTNTYV